MSDPAALNGGSGKSTTPQTRQNRCYQRVEATPGSAVGSCVYVGLQAEPGHELVPWWEEIDGVRYRGETLIIWHGNQQRWIHMGCDRPMCATCNSHGFGI